MRHIVEWPTPICQKLREHTLLEVLIRRLFRRPIAATHEEGIVPNDEVASTAALAPNRREQRQPALVLIKAPGGASTAIEVDDEFLAAPAGTLDDQEPRAPALDQNDISRCDEERPRVVAVCYAAAPPYPICWLLPSLHRWPPSISQGRSSDPRSACSPGNKHNLFCTYPARGHP
jgi:hypothetical protein